MPSHGVVKPVDAPMLTLQIVKLLPYRLTNRKEDVGHSSREAKFGLEEI